MFSLLLATRNRHKTAELAAMLGPGFVVEDLNAHPEMPETPETGATFLENATLKAVAASRFFGGDLLVLADDSGLEVDALGGAPGVFSARFSGEGATDRSNLELLLAKMQGVPDRSARFRCAIALARGGERAAFFEGACEGRIIEAPRGCDGFGYDPVFVPEGGTLTFAEIASNEKNALSHRARAMALAIAWLRRL
ncbi:MAG: RdgB/HAM1 family non-canonical purine NTP pyrophosphatase [Chthoniobacteraceae bacterium]|nr:RdgB/HAM1 family non-canonical purine NTP pyrophosphatase [Chthoniobacteraceae bacterium]